MSELREALDVIQRIDFHEPMQTTDQSRIAAFLERAANELVRREEAVAEREQAVSRRESSAELRETEARTRIKTLESVGKTLRTLELRPKVIAQAGGRKWFR